MKRSIQILWILILPLLLWACSSNGEGGHIQKGEKTEGTAKIENFQLLTNEPEKYRKLELAFETPGFEGNPFDPDEIDIMAEFTSPAGKKKKIPAFWYQEYQTVELKGIGKINTPKGEPGWRIRFCPDEAGDWEYSVELNIMGKVQHKVTGEFRVKDSDSRGFIRIEPVRRQNFVFDSGEAYIPVGENVCWAPRESTFDDYERWYGALSENGGNYSRVWMASWGFGFVWKETGLTDYTNRLDRAYELDRVMELAEEKGIYTSLVLLNHGQFSAKTNPEWKDNPYNIENGGFLKEPHEFFTDERAKEQFKKRLRYIVARWGYSTNIFSWELWNEVDWTDRYLPGNSQKWHQEMAAFLKEMDPFDHLVSSSTKSAKGPLLVDELDFINLHEYGMSNFPMEMERYQKDLYNKNNKPVLFAEIGISGSGTETAALDREGIHLHQGLWAGVMGGGAGTGMTWWWDSYVHPNNLYHHFKPISEFARLIPFTDPDLTFASTKEVKLSDPQAAFQGYISPKGLYLWLYDKKYTHRQTEAKEFHSFTVEIQLSSGRYTVRWFDPYTGNILAEETGEATDGRLLLKAPVWQRDLALVVETKKED